MSNFDTLLAAIAGAPALHGARCRGKSHLFDGAEPGENPATVAARHAQALGLCERCTALARCADWYGDLPKRKRPPGVVAGQVNRGPQERDGRPLGRRRKAEAS
jgi:WhiB family redox-sensing transcriptional regulator